MKQRFWILNLGLLLLLCALLGFAFFRKVQLPTAYQIDPIAVVAPVTQQKSDAIDFSNIYLNNHDLFYTYINPTQARSEKPDYVKPIPLPPAQVIVPAPAAEQPKFLDPLTITLTGVFMFNDDAKNRAIILDNKTKEEITYKIGDEIEDAQLVKIFSHKVLLIRSNGQQETIYLSQDDANIDAGKFDKKDWKHVVKKAGTNTYLVDPEEFINEIKSLSIFIDLFDLSTAYKQGKSLGAKIGMAEPSSLANTLGFNRGDIITAINNLPVSNTNERLAVQQKLSNLSENGIITVSLVRNNQPETITIKLGTITPPLIPLAPAASPIQPTVAQQRHEQDMIDNENSALLQKREKFAPTLRELRLQERKNIVRHQRAVESHTRGNKD